MAAHTDIASVDFGRTADDYARFRGGFPPPFFDRLASAFNVGLPGQRLLDVGTGTGALARVFARCGCEVAAIDPSADLLQQARRLDRDAGVRVEYLERSAEASGFPPASFDVVTAGRCWHWLDRPAAADEVRRVLVPSGTLVIAHFDRVRPSLHGLLEATDELILRWNPAWADSPPIRFGGGVGVYPAWLTDVVAAGFRDVETFSFDVDVPYTHESWRGRVRSGGGIGGTLPEDELARFDAALAGLLAERFADEPIAVTHRAFAVVAHAPLES